MLKHNWYPLLILFGTISIAWTQQNGTQKVTVANCGKVLIKAAPLISHGEKTYPGQYPWHVAIYQLEGPGIRKYICGGSIINTNAILTAAHCVDTPNGITSAEALRVEAGLYDLTISSSNSQAARVFQVIVHNEFTRDYFENDIAMIRLKTYLRYTKYVQPICIPDGDEQLFMDELGILPGWGRNEHEEQAEELKDASMPIIDRTECRKSNRDFFHIFLGDTNFCAGLGNGKLQYT